MVSELFTVIAYDYKGDILQQTRGHRFIVKPAYPVIGVSHFRVITSLLTTAEVCEFVRDVVCVGVVEVAREHEALVP